MPDNQHENPQPLIKPSHFAAEHAAPFQDASVAAAYHHRPPYPAATFDLLTGLIAAGAPRRVLDVGCGPGNLARKLIEYVDQVDAVDFSQAMLDAGKKLPNGDHPNLHWLHGRVEDVPLTPPYGLVTAGASIHWLDWNGVFPRFHEVLIPGGYVAIVGYRTTPDPWTPLQDLIDQYRTDGGFQPYDLWGNLTAYGLFHKVGAAETAPIIFRQSLDDYIASYHSRSGFSCERMGEANAVAFDAAARTKLLESYPDGVITLEVVGTVLWGVPGDPQKR
ncbi:MAG: class I SAM-dependent methyltransferase [Caldilineaceae bacterium]